MMSAAPTKSYIVVRSPVTPRSNYADYRQILRRDFWFTCAYCTIAEMEATGIAFEIDHYEPVTSKDDLASEYSNLMYSCDHCNRRKRDVAPPSAARAAGLRFFKADTDNAPDHFLLEANDMVVGRTAVGKFTVRMLDLNKQSLMRLRAARRRIGDGIEEVTFGLRALNSLPIDKLSSDQKARIGLMRHEKEADSARIQKALMKILRSELLDEDPAMEARSRGRREQLSEWRVLFPEPWSARERK